ncbi:hypothetical protein PHISP_05270 [Aspergillus sp. HF37]|nr:hypothetical protein PHISP_05270 [Aspergillus sp. HF37]
MTSSTTPFPLAPSFPASRFESKLSEQLCQRAEEGESSGNTETSSEGGTSLEPGKRTSPKSRSLSDAPRPSISLGADRQSSKDDSSISTTPATPQRPSGLQPGLSLNPASKVSGSPSVTSRAPLSPKLDPSHIHGSPGSVLPRRSRGLDFSRACTNLHHSTLAESSPESSPTIGGKGVNIPHRRGSHGSTSMNQFSYGGAGDRTGISSSVSSVNMMESDTSSSEEEDEPMGGVKDEMITNTPQINKTGGLSPFAAGNAPSPGNEWMGGYSQAASSLLSFQRARFRKGPSRHSSSSASGSSSKPSPGPTSPPVMKSIENSGGGCFGMRNANSRRRESLGFGARDMRLSDPSDDGDGRASRANAAAPSGSEGGPLGVVRRAVTRRGSLLPKTKTFARIRASLMEETAPIDSEAKREADVIRQVRESEPTVPHKTPTQGAHPSLTPSEHEGATSDADDIEKAAEVGPTNAAFSQPANRTLRESEFWGSLDERYRTPPPTSRQTAASSMSEDDSTMDVTPSVLGVTCGEFAKPLDRPSSRSSTPFAAAHVPTLGDFRRKRRRDDDLDPNLFKRRAVSPSTSIQSSPVMPSSPVVREAGSNSWGGPPKSTYGGNAEANRNGQHNTTPRRVGLQGMNETSDGFMNMCIE